jgi:two-component system, cell cycle sensor histidine kinase and response regulator CckA
VKAKSAESAEPAASAALLGEYEKVLSQVALGAELSAILNSTIRLIDQQLSPARSGIWLAGGDRRLHFAAGPGLPGGFAEAAADIEIGPLSGSCGVAAWRKRPVIVEDIATDPLCAGRREIALAHGLRACWSIPILSAKGGVLAICAVFSAEPRRPTTEEMRVVEGLVHVVRLAIEHWRIAADLKATTALFRALIENTSDIVTVTDPNGIIRYQSPAVERVLGYPLGQLIGTDSVQLLHPDDRDPSPYNAGAPGRTRVVVQRMRHMDGSWRLMEVEISDLREDSAVGGIVSSARDITGRTQAAQALAASEEQYRELFENAQDMLCTLDLAGRFTSLNLTGERITGYPRSGALGKAFWEVVAPEFQESARALVARLMGGEGGAPQELHLITRDGREVPVEISSRLIFAHGKPVGVQCICRDITQRRKLEQQLRQSHKMEAIGLLAGGVAHDFNNLLTVISGCTQWVMQELDPSSEAYENASEVLLAADRAASLTRQLLAFGRAQLFQPARLDLNRVVANIDRMLRRVIGEDIELRTTMAPGLWIIRADPGQIEQVMLNLSLNARDAMPKGGRLVIETANCPPGNESAVLDEVPPGEYVRLSFNDNGQGMDAETQARIFEPFFTTKERGRGTGLGLATVYGIVKQSGGHIRVCSELGGGSKFRLYFPKSGEAGNETAEADDDRIDQSSGDETILLVEDEHGVRQMVREMLRRRGYRILEAADAVSAERIFAEHSSRIHLLLSDVVMPNQSGRELAERLRAKDPHLRILFMSGYTDDAILHHRIESGTAFLQKPFTPDALAGKVRRVLDSK